jgi:hypothetical protein
MDSREVWKVRVRDIIGYRMVDNPLFLYLEIMLTMYDRFCPYYTGARPLAASHCSN